MRTERRQEMYPENDDKTVLDDHTVPCVPEAAAVRVCPGCGTSNGLSPLAHRGYRCSHCKLELAHIDYAPNGDIRGVFGWLRAAGDIVANRYRIRSVLGKGGFGATYLVEDLRLNGKRRALKEVPEQLFDEYETTLLSRLNHPAIPDIIDRAVADGMVYLVLEFGGSRTLDSERKQHERGIVQSKLIPWMRQLCDVLIYLHGQHPPIIHRDLKPDNILLDENERIMLIDFGIAKESNPEAMTRTLGRAATHGFSPPEQVMGTGTDERSDIYALGATFYALLTGQKPPAAHERVAGKELRPPSQIAPEVPPELDEAILQALSLNANHRQQTVREFARVLDSLASRSPTLPTGKTAAVERTVALGQVSRPSGDQQPGIGLPDGRMTSHGTPSSDLSSQPPVHRLKVLLPLLLVAALLAAIATGIYLISVSPSFHKIEAPSSTVKDIPQTSPVQPLPSDRAAPKPLIEPDGLVPQTPQLPVVQPVPQPSQQVPSAQDSPVVPPESVRQPSGVAKQEMPKQQSVKTGIDEPPPKPKPKKPKPVARAPSQPVEKTPSEPAKDEPAWVIIPGSARRTD